MWKSLGMIFRTPLQSASDFQDLWEGRKTVLSFSGLSINRHFLGLCPKSAILRGFPHGIEQLMFCSLHTLRRVGIADCGGDALQCVEAQSIAHVLCRIVQ